MHDLTGELLLAAQAVQDKVDAARVTNKMPVGVFLQQPLKSMGDFFHLLLDGKQHGGKLPEAEAPEVWQNGLSPADKVCACGRSSFRR